MDMTRRHRRGELQIDEALPASMDLIVSNEILIEKHGLPPALHNRLIRLAAFQNPEFQRAQAMHLSTYGKPRIVSCARITLTTSGFRAAVSKRSCNFSRN